MNDKFRLRTRARTRHRSPGREHFQGFDWTVRKLLVLRRPPKCLTTKPEKKPAAGQEETEEELSPIAAISLFTVKKSTVLTSSSIKNRF